MSIEFHVDLKDFNERNKENIPSELVATASDGRLQVGTCFGNGDRRRVLTGLVYEKYGERPTGTSSKYTSASIEELCSSEKPYFSKWSRENPIEFFDTRLRFCWYIPMELQEPAEETESPEDYQRAMLELWNSILEDITPVYHNSIYSIDTWKDLREAIFSDNRYMEPSRFVQGTVRL
jgi:hypothetical protein